MKLALEIIKREIAQRELANKHDHLRKEITTKELKSLNDVVNLLSIHVVGICPFEAYAVFCIECDRQGMKPITHKDYLKMG